jgi:uncharacterized cupin superfamily protein
MGCQILKSKGINNYLVDEDLDPEKFILHVSELPPGKNSHEPHSHEGVESFYILDGHATASVGDKDYSLDSGDTVLINAANPHCITNTGEKQVRYLVIRNKS